MINETTYENFQDKPEGQLFYISDLNQYGIKIFGKELLGNIGHVYNKNLLKSGRTVLHQVIDCKYGNNCRKILSQKYCKFFHEPFELKKLLDKEQINDDFYKTCIGHSHNFLNINWLYSTDTVSKNKATRQISSKETLGYDIELMRLENSSKENIKKLQQQLMHDLLVLNQLEEAFAEPK
jgi:hypothetical protein